MSRGDFIFTGIHISQNEEKEIFLDQNNYIQSLQIFNYKYQDSDNILNREENKLIRKTTGQLSWASSQTRPDLSFDASQLSTILNKAKF